MIGSLNHIAIAVPNLVEAMAKYSGPLGAKVGIPQDLVEHGVTVVFINLPNTKIELISPHGDNSPILSFLKKNPNGGIHHICYEVDCINDAISNKQALRRHEGKPLARDPEQPQGPSHRCRHYHAVYSGQALLVRFRRGLCAHRERQYRKANDIRQRQIRHVSPLLSHQVTKSHSIESPNSQRTSFCLPLNIKFCYNSDSTVIAC